MHVYWTLKSYPELRDLEPSWRRRVWRSCYLRSFRYWQTWAALLSQFLLILAGAFVGLIVDGRFWMLQGDSPVGRETFRFPFATVLLTGLGGMLGSFVFWQVISSVIRPELKRYLETHPDA